MNKQDDYLKLHTRYDKEWENKQTVEHEKTRKPRDLPKSVCDMKVIQNKINTWIQKTESATGFVKFSYWIEEWTTKRKYRNTKKIIDYEILLRFICDMKLKKRKEIGKFEKMNQQRDCIQTSYYIWENRKKKRNSSIRQNQSNNRFTELHMWHENYNT